MDLSSVFEKLGQTWPARVAHAAWEGVKLPGDVYQGNTQLNAPGLRREDFTDAAPPQAQPGRWFNPVAAQPNDEVVGRSFDLAGILGTGGLPMAEPGAAGIFGGRLAKTADLNALRRAEEMTASGQDAKSIWSNTGWARGADGQWRFEIPDNAMTVKFGLGKGVSGPGSKIQHSALAEAYPSLADLPHTIVRDTKQPGFGTFFREQPDAGTPAHVWVQRPDVGTARSTATHELQHAVQEIEGFQFGGNPDEFLQHVPADSPAASADVLTQGAYRHLAGEVEARNVQTRQDFSPDQRTAVMPRSTEDIGRKRQILRASDGSMPTAGDVMKDLAGYFAP
jgi:hypothetical protein